MRHSERGWGRGTDTDTRIDGWYYIFFTIFLNNCFINERLNTHTYIQSERVRKRDGTNYTQTPLLKLTSGLTSEQKE